MRKQVDDMCLENQWEVLKTSLQEATSWSLLLSSTHIKPCFLFDFFLKLNIRSLLNFVYSDSNQYCFNDLLSSTPLMFRKIGCIRSR
jgi:hypothetical protein